MGDIQLIQQLGHTDIANRLHTPARSITQRAGDISLAITGGTFQYNVMAFINVLAGSKLQKLHLVQFAILVALIRQRLQTVQWAAAAYTPVLPPDKRCGGYRGAA